MTAADEPTACPARHRTAHLVLTGGPCGGKSSALTYLTEKLRTLGWRVLVVPEAATLLITGGVDDIGYLASTDRAAYLSVQRELVGLQLTLHARYDALAAALPAEKVVVIHDRGIADNVAYMSPEEYRAVLDAWGLTETSALSRYDAVVHLRSAAVVSAAYAGDGYTTANNAARTESVADAAALDEATLAGWVAHPHLHVVGSTGSFASKLERVGAAVRSLLGEPEPLEIERKFLLHQAPDLNHPALSGAATCDIEQVYLPDTDAGEQRVRSRTVAGVSTYVHTVKTETPDATARVEVETPISAETFAMLQGLRADGTHTIRKTRRVFVVDNQRFELDQFASPDGVWLLEAELVSVDDTLAVPGFLGQVTEVTHDPQWRNRTLAARPLTTPHPDDDLHTDTARSEPVTLFGCCQHCCEDGVEMCDEAPHTDGCTQPYCGGGGY